MSETLERLFLSPEEVAARLGCSPKHVRDRCRAGDPKFRGEQTGRGGRWHVSTVTNLLDRLEVREAAWGSSG